MKLLVLMALIIQGTSAMFVCYCNTNHAYGALIRDCPDYTSGQVIGIIWQPNNVVTYTDISDAHCVAAFNSSTPDGWKAVFYTRPGNNKLGYLRLDSGFTELQCSGSIAFNVNTVSKSPNCHHNIGRNPGLVPSTQPQPPTPSKILVPIGTVKPLHLVTLRVPKMCDGPELESGVKQHKTVFSTKARMCPGSGVAAEEGVILEFCKSPDVSEWKRGRRVMDNCKTISKYTPVTIFKDNVADLQEFTGIFIECTAYSFKIARQVCANKYLEIVEVSNLGSFHEITW